MNDKNTICKILGSIFCMTNFKYSFEAKSQRKPNKIACGKTFKLSTSIQIQVNMRGHSNFGGLASKGIFVYLLIRKFGEKMMVMKLAPRSHNPANRF